jgi:hypothetical protein
MACAVLDYGNVGGVDDVAVTGSNVNATSSTSGQAYATTPNDIAVFFFDWGTNNLSPVGSSTDSQVRQLANGMDLSSVTTATPYILAGDEQLTSVGLSTARTTNVGTTNSHAATVLTLRPFQ